MIIIATLDNNGGMMFNSRRQSRDIVLTKKIIEISKGHRLLMNKYSAQLFDSLVADNITVSESFMNEAFENDFCFIENIPIAEYERQIEKIIIFRWNRDYPEDLYFDIPLDSRKLVETTDFQGNSHEKITMEVYEK